jgi:hypothetical protein
MKYLPYIAIQLLICSALMAQTDTPKSDFIREFEKVSVEDINAMPVMSVEEILSMHIGVLIRTREIHIRGRGGGDIVYFVDGVGPHDSFASPGATDAGMVFRSVGDVNCDSKVDLCDAICLINRIFDGPDDAIPDLKYYDADCDGELDAGDVIRILSYLYSDGNARGDLDDADVVDF